MSMFFLIRNMELNKRYISSMVLHLGKVSLVQAVCIKVSFLSTKIVRWKSQKSRVLLIISLNVLP